MKINEYEHPLCEVIEMQMAEVIADSGITVGDPWTPSTEEEW